MADNQSYLAVSDADERAFLFNQYMDKYHKIIDDARAHRHKFYAAELYKIINSIEDISVRSKWDDWKPILIDHPKIAKLISESELNNTIEPKQADKDATLTGIGTTYNPDLYQSMGDIPFDRKIELNEPLGIIDILEAFQRKIINFEKEYIVEIKNQKKIEARAERKYRDAYKVMLNGHLLASNITPVSTWQDLYPLIKDDRRYLNILGRQGSTPLELFWDQVEDLNDKVYSQRKIIEDHLRGISSYLKQNGTEEQLYNILKINSSTTIEQLENYLKSDIFTQSTQGKSHFDSYTIPYIHEQLLIKAKRREDEEKRRFQKNKRKAIEYLTYVMSKKLDPPLYFGSLWDNEKDRILKVPNFPSEYINEKDCKILFENVVASMKKSKSASTSPEPGEYISPKKDDESRNSSSCGEDEDEDLDKLYPNKKHKN
ncbi:hypothetical protein BB561_001478 [Smittium simulii]|uniref:FF domain-containing protein n=1 Tax=Smittium simulii TaxID=133385 RepID=A0A2T9YUB2_9FUNG|nr:hypothetical protein BB561_001478 [Smittium simulii]